MALLQNQAVDFMTEAITEALQSRSRETVNNLLQALDTLLRDKPVEDISMQALAQASGASMSSIYARFRDKHAMVLALHERVVARFGARLQALARQDFDGWSLREIIRFVLGDYLRFAREHEHVYRAVILSGDALIYERVVQQIQLASQLGYHYLQKQMQRGTLAAFDRQSAGPNPVEPGYLESEVVEPDIVGQGDLEQRVDFAVRVVAATLQQTWVMQTRSPSRFALEDPALVEQLTELALLYITVQPAHQESE